MNTNIFLTLKFQNIHTLCVFAPLRETKFSTEKRSEKNKPPKHKSTKLHGKPGALWSFGDLVANKLWREYFIMKQQKA